MKFSGLVGYGHQADPVAGVVEEVITEKPYFGDVLRDTRQLRDGQDVLPDVEIQNLISIVADAYASEHIFAMRYVVWQGVRWKIAEVSVEPPRLILRPGGVYNGPEATAPDAP